MATITTTTYQFRATVPANTLTNGTYYQAYITTKDAQGNVSPQSNIIQFYCYSQPTFVFSNMPVANIVKNSSYNFNVEYNQVENEGLNAYVFNLYNESNILISTSGTLYNTDATLPLTISYLFTGLENNTSYKIQATGVTSQGTQISTILTEFSVQYVQPVLYSLLQLTNNCQEGYTTVTANVAAISGTSNPTPPVYIANKEVDLTANGAWVKWDNNFEAKGNWTLGLWGRSCNSNSQILQMSNTNGDIIKLYYIVDDTNIYIKGEIVPDGFVFGAVIQSNIIPLPTSTQQIFIWLRRINNIYQLTIENRGVV